MSFCVGQSAHFIQEMDLKSRKQPRKQGVGHCGSCALSLIARAGYLLLAHGHSFLEIPKVHILFVHDRITECRIGLLLQWMLLWLTLRLMILDGTVDAA